MKLTLIGHDDRYAVEQLQMALFPAGTEGEAISTLHRGEQWLTATAKITLDGKTVSASRRIKASEETVRLRRRALQQSYYLAAMEEDFTVYPGHSGSTLLSREKQYNPFIKRAKAAAEQEA